MNDFTTVIISKTSDLCDALKRHIWVQPCVLLLVYFSRWLQLSVLPSLSAFYSSGGGCTGVWPKACSGQVYTKFESCASSRPHFNREGQYEALKQDPIHVSGNKKYELVKSTQRMKKEYWLQGLKTRSKPWQWYTTLRENQEAELEKTTTQH